MMLTATQEIKECRDFIAQLENDIQFINGEDGPIAVFVHGHITREDFATAVLRNSKCRNLIHNSPLFPNYRPLTITTIIKNCEALYLRYPDSSGLSAFPTHNKHAIGPADKAAPDAFAVTCLNFWEAS